MIWGSDEELVEGGDKGCGVGAGPGCRDVSSVHGSVAGKEHGRYRRAWLP